MRLLYNKLGSGINWLYSLSQERFFYLTTLIFYGLLYFNVNNKTLYGSFLLLVLIYKKKIKVWDLSLFLAAVASLVIVTGKTFKFLLIPWHELAEGLGNYYSYFIITPFVLLTGLLFFVKGFKWLREKKMSDFKIKLSDWLLVGFLLFSLISVGLSLSRSVAFWGWVGITISIVYYFFGRSFFQKNVNKQRFLGIIQATVLFESVWAMAQFVKRDLLGRSIEVGVYQSRWFFIPRENLLKYRASGTFSHPNELAGWLAILLPIIFALNFKKKSKRYVFVLISGLVGLGMTLGRSAWGAVFVSMGLIYWILTIKHRIKLKIPRKSYFLIGLIGVILSGVFISRLLSLNMANQEGGVWNTRIVLIKEAWLLIKQFLLFGVGINLSVPRMLSYNPFGKIYSYPTPVHSIYFHVLVETGLLASLALFGFIFIKLKKAYQGMIKRIKPVYLVGFLGGVTGFLLNGLFHPLSVFNLTYILIMLSLLEGHNRNEF